MNTIMIILGGLALTVGIVAEVVSMIAERDGEHLPKSIKSLGVLSLITGIVCVVLGNSFKIVPTGYTGVKTMFGQISEQPVQTGYNWKVPFVQSIKLVNNKQQDKQVDAEVWGETVEKTPVFAADIMITYQINGTRSAWIYANVANPDDNLIEQNLVASAIKSAMVELNVKDVTNRSKIEPLVKEKLANSLIEKYGDDTVTVLKVVINNMDFEDSYNQAIAAKSVAQQTYEKQEIENNAAIAKAEADKKVAIANAEAKAQATLIEAQAQADANELLVKSLTNEVLRSKFYDKWNGQLPKVMGEGTVITDIDDNK